MERIRTLLITIIQDAEINKLTKEAFDGLSAGEKKVIYENHPEQLPDGFQPMEYWDELHRDS